MPFAIDTRLELSNPLCRILDKPHTDFTREDLVRVIEQKRLDMITLHYTALDSRYKELKIPVTSRAAAERILADGERVDGSSLFGGLVDVTGSDLYVVPVYKTAFLNPFDAGSLDLTCRFYTREGQPAPFAPDAILQRAAELFRRTTRMNLFALCELEFYLLSDAQPNAFPAAHQRGYHEAAPFVKSGAVVDEMVRTIARVTGAVKYAHSEVGYLEAVHSEVPELAGKRAEQLEIEMLPLPVEEAGDAVVQARWLIRNIAWRRGCVATFVPKLDTGTAGTGQHVHLAVMKDGRNVMTDEMGELSPVARGLVGGLCTHADTLVAVGNTMAASYLRLVPNHEAPTHICWSDRNRSAMIRVPLGWNHVSNLALLANPQQKTEHTEDGGRQTVEIRTPDGSAMQHLLLAGITMAAEWGLSHDEALETARNLYATADVFADPERLRGMKRLPKSCAESSRILLEKRAQYERDGIFPPSVADYVAKLLQAEDDENLRAYLAGLPDDTRQIEARRIMHRDLHRH